jgi:hypothetical protein|tara:strand:- start:143 stop:835 length:693 start_codon:yes stop_codon:yes gene_type:complete
MAKTIEIEAEQHEEQIDSKLLSLIEDNITEIRNSENSNTTIKLIDYVSQNVFPKFKNKDKEKEIKSVRKYLLAVYPFDDSIGVSRGAYDMMNQRVSKGGHLVFKKRITIDKDKLLDKKGDRIVISKLDELHNKFIDKKPKQIEVVDEPITMPQNDEDYVPSSDFNEISDSYSRADSLMEMLSSLMSLTDADFSAILEEHDLQIFVKENGKPLQHLFDRILESGKQQSKVA